MYHLDMENYKVDRQEINSADKVFIGDILHMGKVILATWTMRRRTTTNQEVMSTIATKFLSPVRFDLTSTTVIRSGYGLFAGH